MRTVGEEYQVHGAVGLGGGVTVQASCAVELGNIPALLTLTRSE